MKPVKHPWDQQDGEPDAAYARFLIYRNLGPSRSLIKAQKLATNSQRKLRGVSGQWHDTSAAWDWVDRAIKWDIHNLTKHGDQAVLSFVDSVKKAAAALSDSLDKMKPKTWPEVMEGLQILASYIPHESVSRLAAMAGADQPEPDGPRLHNQQDG